MKKFVGLVVMYVMLMGGGAYAAEVGMEAMGTLPGGAGWGGATGVNADGTVVVGYSDTGEDGGSHAYRWTGGEAVDLGTLGGTSSGAMSVSADGNTIVGYSRLADGSTSAFKWTAEGGIVNLGNLGVLYSVAFDVSGDGNTIVGRSAGARSPFTEAFIWTEAEGMRFLGSLPGGALKSTARGVNFDGSVVVGEATNADAGMEAYRWTAETDMVGLGFLEGGNWSKGNDVSDDGAVVVGSGRNAANGTEAFRWENGVMEGLGNGGFASGAYAVSGDGTTIVGYLENAMTEKGFRWTEEKGMQSLAEWLADDGYILNGWGDMWASDVNSDGSVVVGEGEAPDGGWSSFIARGKTPAVGGGLIAINQFVPTIGDTYIINDQGSRTTQTILHGAHGHPGSARALNDRYTMWVAGDYVKDGEHGGSESSLVSEIGVSYRSSKALSFGVSLGRTSSKNNSLYSGEVKSTGNYFVVDTDIKIASSSTYLTLTYLQGRNDILSKRGYENAGNQDSSYGSTGQASQGYKVRLQSQGKSFHPYIEYNRVSITTDAYTEIGGGFPVYFNESKDNTPDWRIGFDADYKVNTRNRILYGIEGVRRTVEQGSGVSGNVIGLFSFDMAGREYDQDWARGTLGIEHTFSNKGRLTVTTNVTSTGEDPQYWTGVNYSIGL